MFDLDLTPLVDKKNLLAFSAGVDSTALFFLLLEADIPFDIALVNYHTREQSDQEADYARELSQTHHKKLFYLDAQASENNFEHEARAVRYAFFERIIEAEGYEMLITAHQLNDRLEWLLMQLTKGAGALELLGMKHLESRNSYTLVRPLLGVSKQELIAYLDQAQHRYFQDSSNEDQRFKRNYFRHNFSDTLIETYAKGIQKSFAYLDEDKRLLLDQCKVETVAELTIIRTGSMRLALFEIDKDLKRRGYILSHAQRAEIEKHPSVIISDRFVIERREDSVYISPWVERDMPKTFKEACRKKGVPLKLRPFLLDRDIGLDIF